MFTNHKKKKMDMWQADSYTLNFKTHTLCKTNPVSYENPWHVYGSEQEHKSVSWIKQRKISSEFFFMSAHQMTSCNE